LRGSVIQLLPFFLFLVFLGVGDLNSDNSSLRKSKGGGQIIKTPNWIRSRSEEVDLAKLTWDSKPKLAQPISNSTLKIAMTWLELIRRKLFFPNLLYFAGKTYWTKNQVNRSQPEPKNDLIWNWNQTKSRWSKHDPIRSSPNL